jgi:hypothetical protein
MDGRAVQIHYVREFVSSCYAAKLFIRREHHGCLSNGSALSFDLRHKLADGTLCKYEDHHLDTVSITEEPLTGAWTMRMGEAAKT